MIQLRNYQQTGNDKVIALIRSGTRRIIEYCPTGGGKTEMGMELIKWAIEHLCVGGQKVLFVANRIELILQTSRRFDGAGIQHGIIQSTNTCYADSDVLICSIQTLARRGVPLDVGFVVIDEAHGTAAAAAYHKLMHSLDCPVVGMTATPFATGLGKHHKELCGPLWEELVVTATIPELIKLEHLVDCEIYAPSAPDLSKVHIVHGDYNEKELGVAVNKVHLVGDIVEQWKLRAGGRKTVCFATDIAHSRHICERFKASGVEAEHIDSYMPENEVKAIMTRVRAGEVTVICNVGMLCEGVDVPFWEVEILARPTRSLSRYIQMAGRILRPFEGKSLALILDHSGSCEMLGFPTDDLPLFLDDGRPKLGSRSEPREKQAKKCPKCKFMKRPGQHQCPRCGHEPQRVTTIFAQAGELQRMERAKTRGIIANADAQKLYDELLGYAADRGYKNGWAYFAMSELRNECPRWGVAKPPSPETMRVIQYLNIRRANKKRSASGAFA